MQDFLTPQPILGILLGGWRPRRHLVRLACAALVAYGPGALGAAALGRPALPHRQATELQMSTYPPACLGGGGFVPIDVHIDDLLGKAPPASAEALLERTELHNSRRLFLHTWARALGAHKTKKKNKASTYDPAAYHRLKSKWSAFFHGLTTQGSGKDRLLARDDEGNTLFHVLMEGGWSELIMDATSSMEAAFAASDPVLYDANEAKNYCNIAGQKPLDLFSASHSKGDFRSYFLEQGFEESPRPEDDQAHQISQDLVSYGNGIEASDHLPNSHVPVDYFGRGLESPASFKRISQSTNMNRWLIELAEQGKPDELVFFEEKMLPHLCLTDVNASLDARSPLSAFCYRLYQEAWAEQSQADALQAPVSAGRLSGNPPIKASLGIITALIEQHGATLDQMEAAYEEYVAPGQACSSRGLLFTTAVSCPFLGASLKQAWLTGASSNA